MANLDKNDFKNASVYLIRKFEKQIRDRQKLVYPHLTCAKGRAVPSVASIRIREIFLRLSIINDFRH